MEVLFKNKCIHFVGVGGIGMSGIAEILLRMGFPVQGSDLKESSQTKKLRALGATIFIGQKASQVEGADVVVFSSACGDTNPEIAQALELHIPVIRRAEMLAELMRLKFGVAVAGSHGKTTTTSMLGQVVHEAGLDPTVIIGGIVRLFESNARHGKGELLIAEADESDGSFLHLNPAMAIVTNIDREHMNHYQNLESLKDTFRAFVNKVPFYGAAIVCMECPIVREIYPDFSTKVRTYGLTPQCHYYTLNAQPKGLGSSFEVIEALPERPSRSLGTFEIRMGGQHNVLNALACITTARELGIPEDTIRTALKNFAGVDRRLQYLVHRKDVCLIDDYGHHPTEIKATLKAVRQNHPGRILTLFQPHRYSRTQELWKEFSSCFFDTDMLFVMDIYPASEKPIPGVDSQKLVQAIEEHGHRGVHYLGGLPKENVLKILLETYQPGDTILTLGAGSTYDFALTLAQKLKKPFTQPPIEVSPHV